MLMNMPQIDHVIEDHYFFLRIRDFKGGEQTEQQQQRQGERQIGSHWVHCVLVPLTLTLKNGSGTD